MREAVCGSATRQGLDDLFQTQLSARRHALQRLVAFAARTSGFTLDAVDDLDFPARFVITFQAPGFGPPQDELARPADPIPRDEHTVQIALPPDYPLGAPIITWLTPVFHPNITDGSVCLPFDGPDLEAACQAIIDLTAYRNYEVRPEDFGGSGFLNLAAAAWAISAAGQDQIVRRGGVPPETRRAPRAVFSIETRQRAVCDPAG